MTKSESPAPTAAAPAAAPEFDDARARRNVGVLVCAQAVLGAQMPLNFVMGGLAGQMLSPEPCLATLPISLIVAGSMLSAPVVSGLMGRRGRRTGFFLGAAGGAGGAALAAIAMWQGSFILLCLGALLTGIYMSAQGFYRFAAADGASETFRPKAISWVMAGGLISAVVGPQLFKVTQDAVTGIPFAGGYLAAAALNLVAAPLFLFLDSPRPARVSRRDYKGRSLGQLLSTPRIVVAMICAMVSYALMNLVMTSTPLAVVGCGLGKDTAADVVTVHVLAMFAPSFFTGHFINRFGVERVIATGLVILGGAGLTGLAGVELENFYIALFLLGVGWNFGFIGATSMLAGAHTIEERPKVQGMNDFMVFGLVTVASLASGGLMNCAGGDPVEGWTAVNLAMIPFLALAGAALVWFAVRRPEAF